MNQLQKGQEEERTRSVEDLLRAAADYAAEEPEPPDFVWRALEPSSQQQQYERRRQRPSLLIWTLFGSCAVPAALALAMVRGGGESWPAPYLPSDPYFRPSMLERSTLRPRASADSWPPARLTSHVAEPDRELEKPAPKPSIGRRVVFTSGERDAPSRSISRGPGPAPVLKARWEVETVRHDEARISAPGWVVETDPESGLLIAQPGRVEATVPLPDSLGSWHEPAEQAWPNPAPDLNQESEK